MSLKSKIGLILLSVFVLYGVVDFGIQRFVIFPSFLALERKEAITDVKRSVEALQQEINFLDYLVWDWAAWDDTYEFIQTRSDAYIAANLVEETFTDDDLNVLYFIDTKGKVIWGETRDRQMEITRLPEFPAEALPAKHPLLSYKAENKPLEQVKISGVYMTRTGPMLISSRPILTSQSDGPARGSVIMAKYLTDKIIKKLAEQTQVDFQIFPIVGGALPEPLKNIPERITDESRYLVEAADSDNLNVYTTVPDTKGDAVLLITTKIPRDISAQGFTTMRYALYSIIAAGVGVLLIMLLLLQWTILKPLTKLTRHALAVGKNADLASRLDLHRKDELGTLANEFNEMVKKLSDSRSQLMQLSRDAGMADVATGVLHNVGNVMNSINVSTSCVTEKVRKSRLAGLSRLADLMREHTDDIGEFITQDEHGKQLPAYLLQLSDHWQSEQNELLGELGSIAKNLEHVNSTIQAQQRYTQTAAVKELTSLTNLADSALTMVDPELKRHEITVDREIADLPLVPMDRAKVMQILVNLLTNAKKALKPQPEDDRRITLRARRTSENRVSFEVIDNGIGIPPENTAKIFADGFTTNNGGRGIGLHYAALAAREMGCSLTVHSDGPGRGATFSLELPVENTAPAGTL